MNLYDIMCNRTAVRILKLLDNNEKINKSYSLSVYDIKKSLGLFLNPKKAIEILRKEDLVIVENGSIAITSKGKQFIELVDELIVLMQNKTEKRRSQLEIKYDLTPSERRMLLILSKMQQESGSAIQLKNLSQELYPYDNYTKKQSAVSKELSKLEALHLIEKIRQGRSVFIMITDSGMRIVKEEIEKEQQL